MTLLDARKRLLARAGGLACAAALLASPCTAATPLDEALAVRERSQAEGVRSQKTVDALADETESLFARYRQALERIDALETYNRHLDTMLENQTEEIASIRSEIDDAAVVGRQITPLLLRMTDALAEFVELDVPFLPKERHARIERLRSLLDRPELSDAAKYRSVLEAYQVETDYGRTIEAYAGPLEDEGVTRQVEYLRIGRIGLFYQTVDGSRAGFWDARKGRFRPLDGRYRNALREGLRMARKQAAPDLLRLPMPAAEPGR